MARRLNLDGDGQADLIGHGGENRAMLVYQIESYQYWQQLLGDAPYEMGRFGENLTVEGLADRDVCIGDQFRIGKAIVEVTQPRVTCYRLGIRMNRPDMPSLLVRLWWRCGTSDPASTRLQLSDMSQIHRSMDRIYMTLYD